MFLKCTTTDIFFIYIKYKLSGIYLKNGFYVTGLKNNKLKLINSQLWDALGLLGVVASLLIDLYRSFEHLLSLSLSSSLPLLLYSSLKATHYSLEQSYLS